MVKKAKPFHKQASVKLTDNREITCDEKMAPLIRELNEAGLITVFSCQGGRMPGLSRTSRGTRKRYFYKSQLILDLRSIAAVSIDGNYLTLEWHLKNPKKNYEKLQCLTRIRSKSLNRYDFGKKGIK